MAKGDGFSSDGSSDGTEERGPSAFRARRARSTPAVVCLPALAFPEHTLTSDDVIRQAQVTLAGVPHLNSILRIVRSAGIDKRHLVQPLEKTLEAVGFGTRNDLFIETVKRLGEEAAWGALREAKLEPKDIDLVITTSCTGIMIPSLCAHLMPTMGFRSSCKRLPITELGCAAGAVALSRAREFCQVYPNANVLIIATEMCSLTYQPADFSMQALIGALLFGDGCAAAVVRGGAGPGAAVPNVTGLTLEANDSHLFADSWGYMGFDIRDSGMHLVLDKGIPNAVEKQIKPVFLGFLDAQGVAGHEVDFFCMHPGGRKVLDEIERVFDLKGDELKASRDCLKEVGNLSSASIFVVLKNTFERYRPSPNKTGLLAAFGPGFSAEMVLCSWNEA
jgi:1,3,6,8-tetrahydroxynaphthalene synthase